MALNVQCKKCANLRNDWCKLVVDSPDPDMVRDCKYYMGNTNADKYLRNATDEELAEWLTFVETKILEKQPKLERAALEADWLEWLKQEVNDVDFD